MKRLLIIISGNMSTGGAETFMMKIYRKIEHDKFIFDFCVANENRGVYDKEIQSYGGEIIYCPPKAKQAYKHFKSLYKIIKAKNYDAVLRIGSNSFCALDLWVAKFAGIKKIAFRSSNAGDNISFRSILIHKLFRKVLMFPVNIKIAPSSKAAIYTFGNSLLNKRETFILKNAIDLEEYKYSDESRQIIREEFGIAENQIVFGHIGRFSKQKNHSKLLRVFYEIRKYNKNAKLILVGDGELKSEIVSQIDFLNLSENVILTGIRRDIPRILSAMDLVVFPSLYEGMPNTIIEAQACGLPCLLSDEITEEVKITSLIRFKNLQNSDEDWARDALNMINFERTSENEALKKNGYDISDVSQKFLQLFFD